MRVSKLDVAVLLSFASAWTSAMRLSCVSLCKTTLWTQPPLKARRNTAAFVKSDLCMGVGVSERSTFGLGVVNDPNSLKLCESPDRCAAVDAQFLGYAANTDAAAVQITSEEQFTFIPCPFFSRGIRKQIRVRSTMIVCRIGQVHRASPKILKPTSLCELSAVY